MKSLGLKVRRPKKGAVVVEAALVMALFMILIGGFVYLFYRFYLYQALLDGVMTGLRKAAVDADADFETFEAIAGSKISDALSDFNLLNHLNTSPAATTCYDPVSNRCMLKGFVTWNVPCDFCELLPLPTSATVSALIAIEDPCFISRPDGCAEVQVNRETCT